MLRYVRAAGVVATILTLAACGQAGGGAGAQNADSSYPGKSAQEVLDLARAAVKDTTSLQLDGTATATGAESGAATGSVSGPVSFTFHVVNGAGSSGDLAVSGGTLKVLVIGDRTYTRMDQKLLDQLGPVGASLGSVLNGKWVVSSAEEAAGMSAVSGSIGSTQSTLTGLTTTSTALGSNIPAGSTLTRVAGKVINGVQTTGVHFTSPKTADAEAADGTVYIATSGKALPVGVERSGMSFQFSHWNQKVKIAKPAKSDVISVDKLGLDGLSTEALNDELGSQLSGYAG